MPNFSGVFLRFFAAERPPFSQVLDEGDEVSLEEPFIPPPWQPSVNGSRIASTAPPRVLRPEGHPRSAATVPSPWIG